MKNELINRIAHEMCIAYANPRNWTLGDCCHEVAAKFLEVEDHTFKAMWVAIDTYVGLERRDNDDQ